MSGLTLEDRAAIEDLISRYNHAIDHWDAEGWAALFTADGALTVNGATRVSGREALTAYLVPRREARAPRIRHWVTNLLVSGDAAAARVQAYVMAFKLDDGLGAPYVMGEYDDEVVKEDGAWRFRRRNLTIVGGASATGPGAATGR